VDDNTADLINDYLSRANGDYEKAFDLLNNSREKYYSDPDNAWDLSYQYAENYFYGYNHPGIGQLAWLYYPYKWFAIAFGIPPPATPNSTANYWLPPTPGQANWGYAGSQAGRAPGSQGGRASRCTCFWPDSIL